MKHNWYPRAGGKILGDLWAGSPMKVMLLKPTYVPAPDVHLVYTDISAQEIVGTGYAAGGLALANLVANYDAAQDRTNLLADDSVWGPGATFDTGFAAIYNNAGAKPLWSLVDFEAVRSVVDGVFTLDWQAIGLLYVVPVAP